MLIKWALCNFAEQILIRWDIFWAIFKLNIETFCFQEWVNKQAYLMCLHLADPATVLASNSVLGSLFSSENSLFSQLQKI